MADGCNTPDWAWPAPRDDGGADHLTGGTRLPDVALPSTTGEPINLARTVGRAIVFVYPFTGTPGAPNPPHWDDIPGAHGSTPEAQGFRDHTEAMNALGYGVYGMSGQTSHEQRAFAVRLGLPFALLSDAAFRFADALHLPRFETGGTVYLRRVTLIVNSGAISRVVYPVHPPDRHAAELFHTLKATAGI